MRDLHQQLVKRPTITSEFEVRTALFVLLVRKESLEKRIVKAGERTS